MTQPTLRNAVILVATLNLGYFGVDLPSLPLLGLSRFSPTRRRAKNHGGGTWHYAGAGGLWIARHFLEDTSIDFLIAVALQAR